MQSRKRSVKFRCIGTLKRHAITSIANLFNRATTRDESRSMEIKLCSFIAEHNLPISLSDDLVELLRSLFPHDTPLTNVRLGKQKATNVIRQVIGFDYLFEAVSALRSRMFSMIIDETTDLSTIKQLAVLATYFDMQTFAPKYFFLTWSKSWIARLTEFIRQ